MKHRYFPHFIEEIKKNKQDGGNNYKNNSMTSRLYSALKKHDINLATNILENNEVIVKEPCEDELKKQNNWKKVMINGKIWVKKNRLTMLDALFYSLFDVFLNNRNVLHSWNHLRISERCYKMCIAINEGIDLLAKHGFDFKQYIYKIILMRIFISVS